MATDYPLAGYADYICGMEIRTLLGVLEQPQLAADHLRKWGLTDIALGQQVFVELAETGLTLDLLAGVCRQLAEHLPRMPDPDAALADFRRYLLAVRSPLGLAGLFERDPAAMRLLLCALSLGPRFADLLVADPEAFDLLRQTAGQPLEFDDLKSEVLAEVAAFGDERAIVAALARIWQRHLLRIAYGESTGGFSLTVAQAQLRFEAPPELPDLPDFLTTHIDPFSGDDNSADLDGGTIGAVSTTLPPMQAARPAMPTVDGDVVAPSNRNAPCPCGSGRKYKHCHGAL